MGSSVAYCEPCFREVMEESEEADAGNDCNEAREDQVPEKQEERTSTIFSLARNGPMRFNMYLNVDREIRNVFLNLASE